MTGKGVNKKKIFLLRIQTLFLHWLGKFEDSLEIHYAWECTADSVAGDRQATSLSTQHNAAALPKRSDRRTSMGTYLSPSLSTVVAASNVQMPMDQAYAVPFHQQLTFEKHFFFIPQ